MEESHLSENQNTDYQIIAKGTISVKRQQKYKIAVQLWKKRYNGTQKPLIDQSLKLKSHPNQHSIVRKRSC